MRHRSLLISSELSRQLLRERHRAERSGRPLVLVRLNAPHLLAPANPSRDLLIKKLFSITRQTDLIGWLEPDAALGLVCTESGRAHPSDAGKTVTQKVRRLLSEAQPGLDERQVDISYTIEPHLIEPGAADSPKPE